MASSNIVLSSECAPIFPITNTPTNNTNVDRCELSFIVRLTSVHMAPTTVYTVLHVLFLRSFVEMIWITT